jgi:hypothetical protein
MIQRTQSVYLLLVTVLMSFMLFRPYAEFVLADGQKLAFHSHAIVYNDGAESPAYKSTVPITILVVIVGLLSFINIFLFNNRIRQLRICLINVVFLLSLLIVLFSYYTSAKHSFDISFHSFRIPAIFPLVSIILTFLAYWNIHKDELLVDSYNRIR